jgi:hypothetical protein
VPISKLIVASATQAQRTTPWPGQTQAAHQLSGQLQFIVGVVGKVFVTQSFDTGETQSQSEIGRLGCGRVAGCGIVLFGVGGNGDAYGVDNLVDNRCIALVPEHAEGLVEHGGVFGTAYECGSPRPVHAFAVAHAESLKGVDEGDHAVHRCHHTHTAQHAGESHGHVFDAAARHGVFDAAARQQRVIRGRHRAREPV